VTDTGSGAHLWDPAAGSPAGELLPGSEVDGRGPVAFSPDGTTVAHAESVSVQPGALAPEELRFWDTRTLATTRALTFAGNGQTISSVVEALAYSPDGSLVAVGGEVLTIAGSGAQVALVDPARVKVARMLVTPSPTADDSLNGKVTSLAFNPDGRTLAVATANVVDVGSGVRLWDPASGRLLTTLTTDGGGTVAYSPDGRLLSFGTADGDVVEVLDLARRTQVAALQLGQTPDGTPSYSGGQQFDPNGRLLAVPVGPTVQLWSIPGGTTPRPSTSQSLPPTSGAGAGAQCGTVGTSPSGGTLELIIRNGSATCAQALTVLHDYRASKNRQGSGGFATVDGWTCGHNSFAGFQQSGEYESCQRGNDGFVTHGK
jgi:WD40 repeat protein